MESNNFRPSITKAHNRLFSKGISYLLQTSETSYVVIRKATDGREGVHRESLPAGLSGRTDADAGGGIERIYHLIQHQGPHTHTVEIRIRVVKSFGPLKTMHLSNCPSS